nr:hypothetical protein [Actinacidiphila oryziradicis]
MTGGVVDPLEGAGEEFAFDVVVRRSSVMARSSAAPRPSRFISCTVKITRWRGTAVLMVRAKSIALTNSGRTLIRVLIFSEKTGSHPASSRASSWLWSSCWAVLQRA